MAKVMIAMSGGVDSSVAAFLALQQGYECVGSMMRLWDSSASAADDAQAVAQKLSIPFLMIWTSECTKQR